MADGGNYIEWDEYFMCSAILASRRSKDPMIQVGAVLIDKYNHIIGNGYNGMPNGTPDGIHWGKSEENPWENKHNFVVHAELNCILNSSKTRDTTMYVTLFPCQNCAKAIVQAGIKKLVYSNIRTGTKEEISRYILSNADIEIEAYSGIGTVIIKNNI